MAKRIVAVEVIQGAWIAGGKTYPQQALKVGQKMFSNDPRVKAHSDLFLTVDEIIEQATAAPGERRVTKPKPKPRKRDSDRNARNKAEKQAASTKAKKAEAAANEKARAAREAAEKKAVAEK